MDALALLCTLYADGPRTLKRLREVNGGSIEKVESLPAEDLAHALQADGPAVERFLREARRLAAFERTALDPETEPETNPETRVQHEPDEEPSVAPVPLETLTMMPLGSVTPPEPPTAPVELARDRDSAEEEEARPMSDLHAHSIDGLDEDSLGHLTAAGIASLEELGAFDCLTVTRESGLPYTHVRRLQFLARRRLEERGTPEPARTIEETLQPLVLVSAGKVSPAGDPFHENVALLQREVEAHGVAELPEPTSTPASGPFAGPF